MVANIRHHNDTSHHDDPIELDVEPFELGVNQATSRVPLKSSLLHGIGFASGPILSCVRIKDAWCQVEPYPSLGEHPGLASHLLVLPTTDGSAHVAIYPISTLAVNMNLVVDTGGAGVMANIRRCIPGQSESVYAVVARGKLAHELVRAAVDRARTMMGGIRTGKRSFWDGLGICTWESFGANRIGPIPYSPTTEELVGRLPSHPIEIYLIDDGWQDHNGDPGGRKSYPPRARLRSFGSNSLDMKATVHALKQHGVQRVGVWMAMEGYWFGIDPEGELGRRYNCQPHPTIKPGQPRGGYKTELELLDPRVIQWLPHPAKAAQFWLDWLTIVKSWGVDFVKVDNQAYMECVQSPTARYALAAMWHGVVEAVEKVWGTTERVIMCMSHNERMLNGPGGLGFGRPAGDLVFRNSDDYNMPYANPHGEFALWNTRMTILTSHLSLVPDFDMFASNPASHRPLYHALLRSLSTGSLLLSDTPRTDTDVKLLDALTGLEGDGRKRLCRSETPAVQLNSRWFDLDLTGKGQGKALMAGVFNGDVGVLGAWNCRDPAARVMCHDRLEGEDLLALGADSASFAIASRGYSKHVKVGTWIHKPQEPLSLGVTLATGECEAFTVCRLFSLGSREVAVLGMDDKLYPFGGVSIEAHDGAVTVRTRFHTAKFVLWCSEGDGMEVKVNGQRVEANIKRSGDGYRYELPVHIPSGSMQSVIVVS